MKTAARYIGKICSKHPELLGERILRNRNCSACKQEANYRHRRENKELYNNYAKEYRTRPIPKEQHRLNEHEQRLKYPERSRARSLARYAVKIGALIKKPCNVCGSIKVEGHHPNYDEPLNVIWLCKKHHVEAHATV
jgi:hypothetical protein